MFNSKKRPFVFVVLACWFVIAPAMVSRSEEPTTLAPVVPTAPVEAPAVPVYTVVKRIPKLTMYPCDDCHSSPTDFNPTKRELKDEHTDKKPLHPLNNNNDPDYWCTSCHQTGDHLKLRLFNGRNISFNEGYLICLQCHGNYKDEFESGIHGRKTGHWDTEQPVFNSCPTCHDPHNPKFKPIHPEPAPNPARTLK